VNFLDQVNVGFAALGFTPSIFGAGAGIFFIGYLLFEIPSNLALQRFGRQQLPPSPYAGADARYGWHLCRRQHLLVAADSDPDRKGAAAGLALANSIGNLGGLAGPSIVGVIKQATDSFTALLFLAGAMALGGVIALLFGRTARAGASPSPAIPRAGEQLRFSGIRRRGREFVYALLRFWRLACPRRRLLPTEARP
jgi:hypothetical protein